MTKPDKPKTIDSEINAKFKNFRKKSAAGKVLCGFVFACSWVPNLKEKVFEIAVEGALLAGKASYHGTVAAVDLIGKTIPLPHGFPSSRSQPFVTTPLTFSAHTLYHESYSGKSQGSTGGYVRPKGIFTPGVEIHAQIEMATEFSKVVRGKLA